LRIAAGPYIEPGRVDGRSHVGFGLSRPHGAVAVGHLSLDHTRSELAFRAVVGGIDLIGKISKGEQLTFGASDFGLEDLGRDRSLLRRPEKG
jgi:hypothetical protein